MPAYKPEELQNRTVRRQAAEAFNAGYIDKDSYQKILFAYPKLLYTPDYFIRIGLGILTLVAVLFSGLLLGLLFGAASPEGFTLLLFVFAVACYTALELFVQQKKYFNAGIDNMLMIASITAFGGCWITFDFPGQYILLSGCLLLACAWLCIRFTDAFMGMLAYTAFVVFVFLFYTRLGSFAVTTVPVLLIVLSVIAYRALYNLYARQSLQPYHFTLQAVLFLTLISLYAGGNYFVVHELGKKLMDQPGNNSGLAAGWLLWITTILIPLIYLGMGIYQKKLLFIRTGLLLIGATVFTVRYYYSLLPAELAMVFGGLVLIAISYSLMRYLSKPRHGFTQDEQDKTGNSLRHAEALLVAQAFTQKPTPEQGFQFGGGSSGGAGAEGNY